MIDLKSKNKDNDRDEEVPINSIGGPVLNSIGVGGEFDWNVTNEYDPLWPNEYEKVIKELREMREREHEQESEARKRRRESNREEVTKLTSNLYQNKK